MTTKRTMRAWLLTCVLTAGCGGDDDASDAGTMQQSGGCPEGAICRGPAPVVEDLDKAGPSAAATFPLAATANSAGATVYYPTDAAPPFAYAVFAPPYQFNSEVLMSWGPFFASHGIVLATMDAASVNDFPTVRSLGLEELMTALRDEHTRADGPLRGKLALERGGVLGWSMGGGAVLTVSGAHPEWKSAILVAPHTLSALSTFRDSARATTTPMLILNGALDTTYLGGLGQSDAAYALLPDTTPKMLYVNASLGHFDWGGPTAGGGMAGRYVMAWEKNFLEGDPRYLQFLKVPAPNAATFATNL